MNKDYYLIPPSLQRFYKVMAFLLSIFALNREFWSFYNMPDSTLFHFLRRAAHPTVFIASLSQFIYLALNFRQHEFNSLAMILTILSIAFLLVVKTTISRTPSYKKAMIKFMEQIHVYSYYCNNRKPHVEEILIQAETYTRWSMYTLSMLLLVCGNAFFLAPIIHNYQNIESVHNITTRIEILIHFWMPIDYEFNFFNYVIMQIVSLYCAILAVSIILLFDITNLCFLYHLIGHINIIKQVLKEEFTGKMTHEEIKCKLIEVTKYYAFIRRIFKDVEAAFGFNIIGIYLHNLYGGGLTMFMIMTAGTNTEIFLSYGLMLPIYMGELILMSLVLENIRIKSDDIPELVYNLRWEEMSVPNQKLVLILLAQVQPVLEFKAAFGVKTGIQPAMNIIKTAFSYYILIKSRM